MSTFAWFLVGVAVGPVIWAVAMFAAIPVLALFGLARASRTDGEWVVTETTTWTKEIR